MTTKINGTTGVEFPTGRVQGDTAQGPAFSAYNSTASSINTSAGKIAFQTEDFDTANCYNNTASPVTLNGLSVPAYTFMPNVAGYYQINFGCQSNAAGNLTLMLNKTGVLWRYGQYTQNESNPLSVGNALVYLNGTTDYLDVSASSTVAGATQAARQNTYFEGFLVRAA